MPNDKSSTPEKPCMMGAIRGLAEWAATETDGMQITAWGQQILAELPALADRHQLGQRVAYLLLDARQKNREPGSNAAIHARTLLTDKRWLAHLDTGAE